MKNSISIALFTTLFLLAVSITGFGQISVETIDVAHYRAFCEGVVPKKCLVVMREGSLNYGTIYDEIENFDFIPGFHYRLKVEIERDPTPAKDTSGYTYRLKEIVKRKKIDRPEQAIDLYGSKWRLVLMNGEEVKRASGAFVVFQGQSRAVYGNGGCNSFRGGFRLEGQKLEMSELVSTKRACLVDWGVEDGFLKALSDADSMDVEQDRLIIRQGQKAILEFVPFD